MAAILSLTGRSTARPRCVTKSLIAFPLGLTPSTPPNVAALDKDHDGLLDAAEDEIAACVAPHFYFDGAEPALAPGEPAIMHRVFPTAVLADGNVEIHVRFLELYRRDGGFIRCTFPQPDWCDNHLGDSQSYDVYLEVTGLHAAEVLASPPDETGEVSYVGTHPIVYVSAGKHHHYNRPLVCPDRDGSACHCADGCGVGHWDRANGAVYLPTAAGPNVGELDPSWAEWAPARPRVTPSGFVNRLSAALGFGSDAYLYDPCDVDPFGVEQQPCTADHLRPFMHASLQADPLFHVAWGFGMLPASGLRLAPAGAGDCRVAAEPLSAESGFDDDRDGIPSGCDPCARHHGGSDASGFDALVDVSADGRDLVFDDADKDGVVDGCDACPGVDDRLLAKDGLASSRPICPTTIAASVYEDSRSVK